MGAFTLSKLQKKQYKEIVEAYGNQPYLSMDDTDYARLKETLSLLIALEYIQPVEYDGGRCFVKLGNFKDFDRWHKDREREERRLSRREWRIALISGFIGLIPFTITTVMPWIMTLLEKLKVF